MNLHNLPEKDFDAEVKRHLANASVAYDPISWERMSQKLNTVFPQTAKDRIIELLLTTLLLSALFFWNVGTFYHQEPVATNTSQIQDSNQPERNIQPPTNTQNNQLQNDISSDKNDASHSRAGDQTTVTKSGAEITDTQDPDKVTSGNKTKASDSRAGDQTTVTKSGAEITDTQDPDKVTSGNKTKASDSRVGDQTTVTKSGAETTDTQDPDKVTSGNKTKASNSKVGDQTTVTKSGAETTISRDPDNPASGDKTNSDQLKRPISGDTRPATTIDQINANEVHLTASGNKQLDGLAGSGPDLVSLQNRNLPDRLQNIAVNELEAPPPVIKPSSSPWFIGFGYAPDISMVGFGETTRPGTNLSVLVEYQLNRRWSIISGITYSMKKYKAEGEDYNPPEGFWYQDVAPQSTDAACDVIDIPINIRYHFNPAKTGGFFVSTGLSSYLMLTEDYYYHYEDPYDPYLVDSWSVNNENRHFLGIVNFSVGYQRAIGTRWFLEIEPFVKVPLSGVGFGQVDLWSTGSSFNLKYNFK